MAPDDQGSQMHEATVDTVYSSKYSKSAAPPLPGPPFAGDPSYRRLSRWRLSHGKVTPLEISPKGSVLLSVCGTGVEI